jgi:hypothetical protein
MKNVYIILLFILLVSCEKKPIKTDNNIPIIINNQDMLETNQTNKNNDFLVGSWIKEWDYPYSSFDDTNFLDEIDLKKVTIYDFHSPVFYLDANGDYRKPMSGLYDGGSLYMGTWYSENSELIIEGYLSDESGENNKFYNKFKILLSKESVLYLLNKNKIEKWVNNVDIGLMVGFIYWNFETLKDYLDQNNNPTLLYERTPLMWSLGKDWELIDYLIETSNNINKVDIFKRNAAHYTIIKYQATQEYKGAKSKLIETIKKLKEKEINFEMLDIFEKTPFDYFESEEMKLEIIN